jgi:hypothetical protein
MHVTSTETKVNDNSGDDGNAATSKLPWMKFFPGDWLRDPAVRCCSSSARGMWFDMLCLMWDAPTRGYLQLPNGNRTRPPNSPAWSE